MIGIISGVIVAVVGIAVAVGVILKKRSELNHSDQNRNGRTGTGSGRREISSPTHIQQNRSDESLNDPQLYLPKLSERKYSL